MRSDLQDCRVQLGLSRCLSMSPSTPLHKDYEFSLAWTPHKMQRVGTNDIGFSIAGGAGNEKELKAQSAAKSQNRPTWAG